MRAATQALPSPLKKPVKGRRLMQPAAARRVLVSIVRVGEDFATAVKQCKNLVVNIPASSSPSALLTCNNCPAIKCLLALQYKCGSGVQLKARTYNSPADLKVYVDTLVPLTCDAVRAAPCKNWV